MISIEELRRRVESVEDLESIVGTMKALAAVQVRRYERASRTLARFDETVALGFQVLLRRFPPREATRPHHGRDSVAAILLGTDQGMCGPFNDRLVSFAMRWYAEGRVERGPVIAVGRRLADLLAGTELAAETQLVTPSSLPAATSLVEELLVRVEAWRALGRFDRLFVFHNRRTPEGRAKPGVLQHLPLSTGWLRELAQRPWTGPSLPTFTQEPDELLSELIRQGLFSSLYRAVAESLESESASRLQSMQAAETNITDLLEELRQLFRQERQAAITAELLDIVSGYETAGAAGPAE